MQHFHHIGLEVGDLFAMERFYRTVLGFKLDYRYESRNTPGLRTIFLRYKQVCLELLSHDPSIAPHEARAQTAWWGHIAIECLDVDQEWEKAQAKATTAGYATKTWLPPRDTGDGYREAVLHDPEGNVIELGRLNQAMTRPTIQAVIFDFDGTLADSEPNYLVATRRMLAGFGIDYDESDHSRYIGGGNHSMLTDLIKRYHLTVSHAELATLKDRIYLEIASEQTRVFPGMHHFLDLLDDARFPLAIASGSSRVVLDTLLARMGIAGGFQSVISSEEVSHGKPAPDVFIEAARRLGVSPQSCLVVEDSRPGVEAALRAFMPCIAIPSTPAKPLDPTFHLADFLVEDGMEAFDAQAAFTWLGRFPAN